MQLSSNILRRLFIIIIITLISCSPGTRNKPLPKQQMSFKKFKESLNTAVFTTKFVVIEKKIITIVRHKSEDGAWTFFSNDKYDNYEEVAKIVGLGELIKIDSTILQISDMPEGFYAQRNSKQDEWKIEKLKRK